MRKYTLGLIVGTAVAVALALTFPTAVNAAVYNWVPDTSLTLQPTSGVLDYSGGILNSFSFSYDGYANPDTVFNGTIVELGNGHLDLDGLAGSAFGISSGIGAPTVWWFTADVGAENYGNVLADGIHPAGPIFGEWVPAAVPEPSTLLLLGSGMVGLVGFRRKFKK